MMLFPLLLAAALSAGNAEFDRAAVNGAQTVALRKAELRIAANGPQTGILRQYMLDSPKDFENAARSKEDCRVLYRSLLDAELAGEKKRIDERLGLTMIPCHARLSESLAEKAMKRFEAYYAEERKAACEEQAKTIAANVKPSEADFGRKDEAAIRAELEGAVIGQQRSVVFEENRKYISEKIVDPIMESAKKELGRQREYLKRTRCDAYAPSALEKELAANLEKNVGERAAKSSDPIKWGVFPVVVEQGAKEVAEKRTLERVAHAIDDVEMKVDKDLIRGRIAADRERHRKASDSEQAFRNVFAGLLTGKALDKVVADAPSAERDEFKEFVMARAGEASLGKAVDSRVKRELLPQVREVRGEIAAEDAAKYWPTLMDGTWFPEPSLADDICSRSDYSKTVKRWRDSPELVTFAKAAEGQVLIEETEKLADGRVAKAFDLARSAINAQNAVLDRIVPEVMGDAKNLKSGWFSKSPDFGKIVEMLTSGVETKWNETREEVLWGEEEKPSNAGEQHRELFPSVKKRIELVAKTILEEMAKPEPEKKPEPEEPPEEKPEDPSESEAETPPEEIEFTISVKKSGEKIETKILHGKDPVFERTCPAKKGDFRSLSGALTDKLVEVLELK